MDVFPHAPWANTDDISAADHNGHASPGTFHMPQKARCPYATRYLDPNDAQQLVPRHTFRGCSMRQTLQHFGTSTQQARLSLDSSQGGFMGWMGPSEAHLVLAKLADAGVCQTHTLRTAG